jgi:hypothetical protein
MKYRSGTQYDKKHTVWNEHSMSQTCPLCPRLDNALHPNDCQILQIRNMITERHNSECSMIFKSISKTGSLTFYFLCIDIGNSAGLAMQNLQIPDTDETRIKPKWLFPPRFSIKNRCTPPAVRMLYWLLPSASAKTKKQ